MRRRVFNRKNIDASKLSIKNILDTKDKPKDKLDLIQRHILELNEKTQSQQRLDCYIYIMSALVHHQRYGGLSSSQIGRYTKFAEAILIAEGIIAGESRLSFLYVELYALLSLIDRQNGDHWKSTWRLMNSFYLQKGATPLENAWKEHGIGYRLLRLGHSNLALEKFDAALLNFEAQNSRNAVLLQKAKCLKLMGRFEDSIVCFESILSSLPEDHYLRVDIEWERATIAAIERSSTTELFKMTNKRLSPYKEPSYSMESYFWSKLYSSLDASIAAKPSSIMKRSQIKDSTLKILTKAAVLLEKGLDSGYHKSDRLAFIGEMTDFASHVSSIERELLILAVAYRVYTKEGLPNLAAVCLERYKSLSHTASNGTRPDFFSIEAKDA